MLRCTDRLCAPTPSWSVKARPLRLAVIAFVCNGTRHGGLPAEEHLGNAVRLRRTLKRLGIGIDTVAVTHGYDEPSQAALRRVGWLVEDVSTSVDHTKMLRPIGSLAAGKAGKHWPRVLRRGTPVSDPNVEAAVIDATDHAALKAAQKRAEPMKNYLGNGTFTCALP